MTAATRRKFFGIAAVSPLAAKAAAEEAISNTSRVFANGLSPFQTSGGISAEWIKEPSNSEWLRAFNNPLTRQVIESHLFESERSVYAIDPDLACLKSLSMSAKITYQRRRNVQRRIDQMTLDYPWNRLVKFVRSKLDLLP